MCYHSYGNNREAIMAKKLTYDEALDKAIEHEAAAFNLKMSGDVRGAHAMQQIAESYFDDAIALDKAA